MNGCRQNESPNSNHSNHTTPVHKLTSWEAKSCVFVHSNASSSEKVHLLVSHIKILPYISLELFLDDACSVQISLLIQTALFHLNDGFVSYKHIAFSVHMMLLMTGVVWIIVMFLSALWTLILTAPIHCRGSIAEQVMQCCNYSTLKAESLTASPASNIVINRNAFRIQAHTWNPRNPDSVQCVPL